MHIALIGAGRVAVALGANLAGRGHQVTFAVREPARADVPAGTSVVGFDQLGHDVDVYILAVPFEAIGEVLGRLRLPAGAVLVDATNPFGRPLPTGVRSGAEHVAAQAGSSVHLVKAFNVLGAEHMAAPELSDGQRPVLPVAGDDAASRQRVVDLAAEMGFDAVDVGGLESAALMEEAARYWGLLAYAGGRGRGVVLVAHQRPLDES